MQIMFNSIFFWNQNKNVPFSSVVSSAPVSLVTSSMPTIKRTEYDPIVSVSLKIKRAVSSKHFVKKKKILSRQILYRQRADIDECDEDNGSCEQECFNTPGSFQCRCASGFLLREDGRTCQPESDTSAAASVVDGNSTVTQTSVINEAVNETMPRCQASCDHVTKMEHKMKRLEEKITAMSTAIKLYSFASGPPGPEGWSEFSIISE